MGDSVDKLGVAVIGSGYWGTNLVRNFRNHPDWDLVAVCDLDPARAARVVGQRSTIDLLSDVDELLARSDVTAVAIATPASTHHALTLRALAAGKHVLVEKPIAESLDQAAEMIAAAQAASRVLMVDHTFCYTPAVRYIRDALAAGDLGDLLYVDSVRINLGLVQPDVNVFWDLAPHDLSILDFVLPGGLAPETLSAVGTDPLGAGTECVGHLSMPVAPEVLAHVHVNWLSPVKVRQMIFGGSRRTLVWDDVNPAQRISIYDRGVDLPTQRENASDRRASTISYRLGDVVVPALPEREALSSMVGELAAAIREERAPLTDGHAAMRVLRLLSASDSSLATGAPVRLDDSRSAA
ncbi:Gfo/Idh/MocA family protein [Janibacter melonis]|uniref:Gfo/Idh/MocA family protein n=1 Tax=Janibacter melonis TaxID=262209 RepID=UPI002043F000|nr:Gfo/Idh/MocA family oxidoreductase [Janibacter melonis]